MKAGSIQITSLLKHDDIIDNTLLNCELILHLHKTVLQYFWDNIFIYQQVIGSKLLIFLDEMRAEQQQKFP